MTNKDIRNVKVIALTSDKLMADFLQRDQLKRIDVIPRPVDISQIPLNYDALFMFWNLEETKAQGEEYHQTKQVKGVREFYDFVESRNPSMKIIQFYEYKNLRDSTKNIENGFYDVRVSTIEELLNNPENIAQIQERLDSLLNRAFDKRN